MRNLPAIATDIDGVLLRGKKIIGKSDLVLDYLRRPLNLLFPDI